MKSAVTSEMLKKWRYIGIDILTADWVGGDRYVINNHADMVYLQQLNYNKNGTMKGVRKKVKEEFVILPESLHEARGITADGKIDYQPENLGWYNWQTPLRKWDFKECLQCT